MTTWRRNTTVFLTPTGPSLRSGPKIGYKRPGTECPADGITTGVRLAHRFQLVAHHCGDAGAVNSLLSHKFVRGS